MPRKNNGAITLREIKFRAWATNEMVYPSWMDFDKKKIYWWEKSERVETKNYILMQYTGLKDNSNPPKEIYEGDIVKGVVKYVQLLTGDTDKNCNFKMCGIVYWDLLSFIFKCVQSMCDEKREGLVNYFSAVGREGEIFEDMEIIGNIYENKELLK